MRLPLLLACSCAAILVSAPQQLRAQQELGPGELIASARHTQSAARATLQVLGDAFTCPEARFVSYRRSDFEPQYVDQWYVASQLWADVALVRAVEPAPAANLDGSAASASPEVPVAGRLGQQNLSVPDGWDPALERCYLEKAQLFLDRQWDYAGEGGYFPRSNVVGTQVESEVRFGDDNALMGLVLIDLAQLSGDELRRQQYLHAARRQADFLMNSGLWDNVFGGGFWWNTTRGSSAEGKPAQTNALAALFFGRLYQLTGEDVFRTWMLRTLVWLDTILYDPSRHLYRWSVSYQDLANRTGATVSTRYLNYDQGLAIQAQLLAAELEPDPNRLPRAVSVGQALQDVFWVPQRGYRLEAGRDQIYTSYAAWSSLGHLALYDATHEERWLAWATANLAALGAQLQEPDGGFGIQVFHCVGDLAQYCPPGASDWIVDHIRDGAAQAWMQHLQTELAHRAPAAAGSIGAD